MVIKKLDKESVNCNVYFCNYVPKMCKNIFGGTEVFVQQKPYQCRFGHQRLKIINGRLDIFHPTLNEDIFSHSRPNLITESHLVWSYKTTLSTELDQAKKISRPRPK